jgi:ankyrin repeat protein
MHNLAQDNIMNILMNSTYKNISSFCSSNKSICDKILYNNYFCKTRLEYILNRSCNGQLDNNINYRNASKIIDYDNRTNIYNDISDGMLADAAFNDNVDAVKVLLCTGMTDGFNFQKISSQLFVEESYKIIQFLLEEKYIDPDIKDFGGKTPLLLAVNKGDIKLTNLLLTVGKADPNIQDSYGGDTALIFAVRSSNLKLTNLLLTVGNADPNIQNIYGGNFFDTGCSFW